MPAFPEDGVRLGFLFRFVAQIHQRLAGGPENILRVPFRADAERFQRFHRAFVSAADVLVQLLPGLDDGLRVRVDQPRGFFHPLQVFRADAQHLRPGVDVVRPGADAQHFLHDGAAELVGLFGGLLHGPGDLVDPVRHVLPADALADAVHFVCQVRRAVSRVLPGRSDPVQGGLCVEHLALRLEHGPVHVLVGFRALVDAFFSHVLQRLFGVVHDPLLGFQFRLQLRGFFGHVLFRITVGLEFFFGQLQLGVQGLDGLFRVSDVFLELSDTADAHLYIHAACHLFTLSLCRAARRHSFAGI